MCSVHHNSKINEGYFLKCFKKHKYISTESVVFFMLSYFQALLALCFWLLVGQS